MHKKIQGKSSHWLVRPAILLLVMAALAANALADPPDRIARLNYITGGVSIRPGDIEDWSSATVNYPLSTGDQLYTDSDARAELHIGSIVARMAPRTACGFLNLDDHTAQIQLLDGSLHVHIRELDGKSVFEVDTPLGAVSLLGPGDYRIDVQNEGSRLIATVRHGEAEVATEGSALAVHTNESAIISAAQGIVSYDIRDPRAMDTWDEWCAGRDGREEQVTSIKYVSRNTVGYEDLDTYGTWRRDATHGIVWIPSGVVEGWAPYRNGRWAWKEPWGWTWVDDSPWGFAPFHYGRWAHTNGYWAWLPGKLVARPVYAPALVAFVGGEPGWGASFLGRGVSGVGWFPLGPGEAYYPGYNASTSYIRQINSGHVTVADLHIGSSKAATAHYVNEAVSGACTAAPRNVFAEGRPLGRLAVPVPQARSSPKVTGATAAIAPTRISVLAGSITGSQVTRPSSAVMKRVIVVQTTPGPPPVSFVVREKALASTPGHPVDSASLAALRKGASATSQTHMRSAAVTTGVAIKPVRYGITATRTITSSSSTNPIAASKGSPKEAEAKAAVSERAGKRRETRNPTGSTTSANIKAAAGNAKSGSANRAAGNKNSRPSKNTNSRTHANSRESARNVGRAGTGSRSTSNGTGNHKPTGSTGSNNKNSNRTGSRKPANTGKTGNSAGRGNASGRPTAGNSKARAAVTVANKSRQSPSNSVGNHRQGNTAHSSNNNKK